MVLSYKTEKKKKKVYPYSIQGIPWLPKMTTLASNVEAEEPYIITVSVNLLYCVIIIY